MSNLSSQRLPESLLGKLIIGLFACTVFFCFTFAGGNEWYSISIPLATLSLTALLYGISFLTPIKHPTFPIAFWVLILPATAYFIARAVFSPGYYEAQYDISLLLLGLTSIIVGIYLGMSKKPSKWFFGTIILIGGLHLGQQIWQAIGEHKDSLFRPLFTCDFKALTSMGLLGYENFSADVFACFGAFLCVYKMSTEKKWTYLFWIGLTLLIAAFFCNSRAAVLLGTIALLMTFLVFCLNSYQDTKKFFVAIGLFIALVFSGSLWLLFELSQSNEAVLEFFKFYSLEGRVDLSGYGWLAAQSEPLFGIGSQQLRFFAIEHAPQEGLWGDPNFAHHEYAQTASDYGYIGLAFLAAILGFVLYQGFKTTILLPKRRSYGAALSAAALTVILIQMQHAYLDFIWHSPGIVCCMGISVGIILSGSQTTAIKKAHISGKITQLVGAVALTSIAGFFTYQLLPIWKINWEKSEQFSSRSSKEGWSTLREISEMSQHPELILIYTTDRLSKINSKDTTNSTAELNDCKQLIEKAYIKNPNNCLLSIPAAAVQDGLGNFEKAEEIFTPYLNPNTYPVQPYGWKQLYLNHLLIWLDDLVAKKEFGKALSIMLYLQNELKTLNPDTRFIPWNKKEVSDQLYISTLYLQRQNIKPDDSWKKHPANK